MQIQTLIGFNISTAVMQILFMLCTVYFVLFISDIAFNLFYFNNKSDQYRVHIHMFERY